MTLDRVIPTITDQEKYQEARSEAQEMEVSNVQSRYARPNLHPRRGRRERFFQALALRDSDRAQPLQGAARTPAPASGPPRWWQRSTACSHRRGRIRCFWG